MSSRGKSHETATYPTRRAARVAGLFYLVVVLTGPFSLLYVPGKLFVSGDAAATAARILAHPSLFQAKIVVGLIAQLSFLATVLALYRLLKGVHHELAAVMAILILIDMPLGFLGLANEVATLAFLRAPGFLAGFDPTQRDVLALLLIHFDGLSVPVHEIFWGLWLLPLGTLVYRSAFLPRFLGVWLLLNGLAYLGISGVGLFSPEHEGRILAAATPVLAGEAALMLWLLTVGVRVRRSELPAST
jgi:hypothetical protein